jgi:hypothetical protein
MRNRLAQLATGATVVLMLALSPVVVGQQVNPGAAGSQVNNPTASRDTSQVSNETMTIRGVIAAVTVEGEAVFDYRSNRAVTAEATFLTVVASPHKGEMGEANRREAGEANRREVGEANHREAGSDDRGSSQRRRHNVYYIWMTPKTKVCEDWSDHGKSAAANDKETAAQKKEVAIDNLEVGDHVEIQFVNNEGWSSSHPAHQTDQMSRKHGRHRTYFGQATAVTIMASRDMNSAKPDATERSNREIPNRENPK